MACLQIELFAPVATPLVEVVALVVVVVVPLVLDPPQALNPTLSRPRRSPDPAIRLRTISLSLCGWCDVCCGSAWR
jgi:hypothetical protein